MPQMWQQMPRLLKKNKKKKKKKKRVFKELKEFCLLI